MSKTGDIIKRPDFVSLSDNEILERPGSGVWNAGIDLRLISEKFMLSNCFEA